MKRIAAGLCVVVFGVVMWQAVPVGQNGEAPTIAFDITKADID